MANGEAGYPFLLRDLHGQDAHSTLERVYEHGSERAMPKLKSNYSIWLLTTGPPGNGLPNSVSSGECAKGLLSFLGTTWWSLESVTRLKLDDVR